MHLSQSRLFESFSLYMPFAKSREFLQRGRKMYVTLQPCLLCFVAYVLEGDLVVKLTSFRDESECWYVCVCLCLMVVCLAGLSSHGIVDDHHCYTIYNVCMYEWWGSSCAWLCSYFVCLQGYEHVVCFVGGLYVHKTCTFMFYIYTIYVCNICTIWYIFTIFVHYSCTLLFNENL